MMRFILALLICLAALSITGCGGGGGGSSIAITATVYGGGPTYGWGQQPTLTAVNVYDLLGKVVASGKVVNVYEPNLPSFTAKVQSSGTYDVELLYTYIDDGRAYGQKVIQHVQVPAEGIDLGRIDLDLPPAPCVPSPP